MIATVVDWGQLLDVVVAAGVAGIGVPAAFSLVIFGSSRADDARRASRPLAASMHFVLAAVGLLVVLGAVVFGVMAMLDK